MPIAPASSVTASSALGVGRERLDRTGVDTDGLTLLGVRQRDETDR